MTLDPLAQETKNVGATLRHIRTQKGLSLESVQQRTRIPRKFLEALEENRFEDFPAPVYLRGFMHTYCEFLDADFAQLWPLTGAGRTAAPPPPVEPAPAPAMGLNLPTGMLIPAGLFVLVIGVATALWVARRESPAKVDKPVEKAPLVVPVKPVHPPQGHALTLTLKSRTWLRLQADDDVKFEGQIPSGTTKEWKAKTGFRLRTPSPENVRLTLDGKELDLSGLSADPSGDYVLSPGLPAPNATAP